MKRFIVSVSIIIAFAFVIFLSIAFIVKDENISPLYDKEFIGYIPKDALPKIHWEESKTHPGEWNDKYSIETIIGKDTFNANFLIGGRFIDSKLVISKGSYPPSIDTIVYVRGHYDQNGIPCINSEAALIPLSLKDVNFK